MPYRKENKNMETSQNTGKNTEDTEREGFFELLRLAQGDRTAGEYAKAAGISLVSLSRINHRVVKPSLLTLSKLTSEEAAPQNGVTYEMLVNAAKAENLLSGVTGGRQITSTRQFGDTHSKHFWYTVRDAFQKSVLDKGEEIRLLPNERFLVGGTRTVSIIADYTQTVRSREDWLKSVILPLMLEEPDRNTDHLLFTAQPELYDYVVSMKGKISYKGNLKVLMINWPEANISEDPKITREEQITTYD
jgi:hypothetical protein